MKNKFLLCVDNKGYEASLELRKLYENIPDKEAECHGQVRIIDESGGRLHLSRQLFCAGQIISGNKKQNS
ncbi:MAG: hypothetical protein ABIH70_08180 [Chloroflexota bacterium]